MKRERYDLLRGEQLVWTEHENAAEHGVCPVDPDEMVMITYADGWKSRHPTRAGDMNWNRFSSEDGDRHPLRVTHYQTCEPRFPMLAKETEAKAAGSQAIGEFLEWAQEQGWLLAQYIEGTDSMRPVAVPRGKTGIIAQFFEIDLAQADRERQQLLDEFVAAQQQEKQP